MKRADVIMLAVAAGLLVCLGALALLGARARSWRICCNCNLKQVTLAFKVWAGDNGDKYPTQVSTTNGGVMEMIAKGDVFSVFQVMSNELNTPVILACPEDRERSPATNFLAGFGDRNVSYFAGVDAVDAFPQMFLSGDRNIAVNNQPVGHGIVELTTSQAVQWTHELHNGQGNVGLADASVQTFSNAALTNALRNTGDDRNRLAMP